MTELETFLENQKKELAIREREIELEREKNIAAQKMDERQYVFAKEQLVTIERDRQNDRKYRETQDKKMFWIILAFIAAAAIFLTTAIIRDKDQVIIELVKAIAYAIPSGAGGYAVGRYKKKNDEGKNQSP